MLLQLTDHMSIGFLSHESAEGNDGRNTREEEKDRRRQTLHVDTVLQHAQVHPRVITVLNVIDESSEKSVMYTHQNNDYWSLKNIALTRSPSRNVLFIGSHSPVIGFPDRGIKLLPESFIFPNYISSTPQKGHE